MRPALLQDFVLRQKITQSNHDRIPERIVHALGSGADRYFKCYETLTPYTRTGRTSTSSSRPNIDEFKHLVDRFHAHGLEVIMDVVYNHTPEGNELGPTLSFKGIDNASYYRLMPGGEEGVGPRYYINDTGTGNTVNLSHPRVLQMVTDSLRYWVTEMHVDGFRFDLATILGREAHGFDEGGGFLDSCRQDPVLSSVKLIAEPWDIGPGGYQVGRFPPGWAEWNDGFRDTVRAFWKGDEAMALALAQRLRAGGDTSNARRRSTIGAHPRTKSRGGEGTGTANLPARQLHAARTVWTPRLTRFSRRAPVPQTHAICTHTVSAPRS